MFSDKDQCRFWSRVPQGDPDACWMWEGFRNPAGYGTFALNGGTIMAHRYSLSLKLGRMLEHPMMACHTCDNPGCVNPNHLFEGTRSDNVRDAMMKGRLKPCPPDAIHHPRGQRYPSAKLNDEKVRLIRGSDLSSRKLAQQYGVSANMILLIKSRKNWAHVA